jgi:hypothetical protein
MQKNHTLTKIRQARARTDENLDELLHLEEMVEQTGGSDFLDDLASLYCDAMTIDGRDERRTARALSYAGFATSWH